LIATGNIIQALTSSFTIGLIIVNVMAIVAYAGWELGSGESVGVVVCVGFAVDYVVHLAAHYIHSGDTDRNSRIKGSLRELGVSILGGSLTTVAAALVLFLCVLSIFMKFAIFVIATILFSVVYSLGFFAALCHVLGPVGPFGDVAHMFKTAKGWYKRLTRKQD
jgi:multidrug efflux pump subunit AcrB